MAQPQQASAPQQQAGQSNPQYQQPQQGSAPQQAPAQQMPAPSNSFDDFDDGIPF